MRSLPARSNSLQKLQETLCNFVEEIGVSDAATLVGVSSDTIRRRTRNEQPWFFAEVLDLAREESSKKHLAHIADALSRVLSSEEWHTPDCGSYR